MSNENPVATFNVGSNYDNDDRRCQFDNLLIKTTEGDYTVSTAKYTVKYVCGGTEIKAAEEREGDVGSAISLFATDKATFDADGKRYIYVSDDLGEKTVAEDGSTVVTITFREAVKYGYTITSSYNGSALPFTQSTQYVWEDENSVTIQCPKYYNVDGTLVVAPLGSNGEPRKSFTITEDNFVGDIEYTATEIINLYLYSEAEDLEGTSLTVSDNTGANDRVSCGKLAYAGSSKLITLPAGKYIFTLGAWGGAGNAWTYVVKAGNNEIINSSCAQNTLKLDASSEFSLYGTTNITITATNTNRTRGIDLIYVQKTGDVELPSNASVTVTAAGYATYCSEYDLNLSGVKAYTATLSGSDVTFTQQTGKVVAGTGLLIKADAGAVNIPVVAEGAAAVADNALVGVLTNTVVGAGSFVLMNGAQGVGFYKTTAAEFTVGAHTAYIAALPAGARSFIGFDFDATTGIEAVAAEKNNGEVYNLNGQRVIAPQKGLYIVNGKKVILK